MKPLISIRVRIRSIDWRFVYMGVITGVFNVMLLVTHMYAISTWMGVAIYSVGVERVQVAFSNVSIGSVVDVMDLGQRFLSATGLNADIYLLGLPLIYMYWMSARATKNLFVDLSRSKIRRYMEESLH